MGSGASTNDSMLLPDRLNVETAKNVVGLTDWDQELWDSLIPAIDGTVTKDEFLKGLEKGKAKQEQRGTVLVAEADAATNKLFKLLGLMVDRSHIKKLWKKCDFKKRGRVTILQFQRLVMFCSLWKFGRLRDRLSLFELIVIECASTRGIEPGGLKSKMSKLEITESEFPLLARDIAVFCLLSERSVSSGRRSSMAPASMAHSSSMARAKQNGTVAEVDVGSRQTGIIVGAALKKFTEKLGIPGEYATLRMAPFQLSREVASDGSTCWTGTYKACTAMSHALAQLTQNDEAMQRMYVGKEVVHSIVQDAVDLIRPASFSIKSMKSARNLLTLAQIDYFEDLFQLFDVDGDQHIDVEEFGKILETLGQKKTTNELQTMINRYDIDGNGEMELFEFFTMMADKLRKNGGLKTGEVMPARFRDMDREAAEQWNGHGLGERIPESATAQPDLPEEVKEVKSEDDLGLDSSKVAEKVEKVEKA